MRNKKKLELEILDSVGNVVSRHEFSYEAGQHNRLRLAITNNVYVMDNNGKLVVLTQEELQQEARQKTENRKTETTLRPEIRYYNPKTQKSQKLFDEVIPVFTVSCRNDNVVIGDKGCAVYITVEAQDTEQAMDKAMLSEEFMKHIGDRKSFDRKYLGVHVPQGNYVIGKVQYFEGDERL
jgi:hypothetical protein